NRDRGQPTRCIPAVAPGGGSRRLGGSPAGGVVNNGQEVGSRGVVIDGVKRSLPIVTVEEVVVGRARSVVASWSELLSRVGVGDSPFADSTAVATELVESGLSVRVTDAGEAIGGVVTVARRLGAESRLGGDFLGAVVAGVVTVIELLDELRWWRRAGIRS